VGLYKLFNCVASVCEGNSLAELGEISTFVGNVCDQSGIAFKILGRGSSIPEKNAPSRLLGENFLWLIKVF
jgi:hypothetical protein